MSDQAPTVSEPQNISAQLRDRRRREGRWFMLSLLLHLATVGALIYLTPIRQVLFGPPPPPQRSTARHESQPVDLMMTSREITEVAQKLEQINADQIEHSVETLQELSQRMRELNEKRLDEFRVFERAQIEQTPEHVQDAMQQAMDAIVKSTAAVQAKQLESATQQQHVAVSHQQTIQQQLKLVEASQPVVEAQQRATEAQQKAMNLSKQSLEANETFKSNEGSLNYQRKMQREYTERVEKKQREVQEKQQKREEYQAQQREKRQQLEQAKAANDEKAVKRAERSVKEADSRLERAQKEVDRKEDELQKYREKLAGFDAEVKKLTKVQDDAQRQRDTSYEQAKQIQATVKPLQEDVARKIQEDVAERVKKILEQLPEDQTLQAVMPELQTPQVNDPASIQELYDAARMMEKQLAKQYRHGRAMRLAVLQNVPFEEALKAIDEVAPERPELPGEAFEGDARNEKQLEARKDAMRTARAETQSMVALGYSLLSQAEMDTAPTGGNGAGGGISLAAIEAKTAHQQELAKLADQEKSGDAVDVSRAMQRSAGLSRDKTYHEDEPAEVLPPKLEVKSIPTPGRKIGSAGEAAGWMSIMQWYTLGPFANPARSNLNRVFPPESLVDLNAAYVGKNGRTITWQFINSTNRHGEVRPANEEPYGIWYAYTELKLDRAQDLWMAMGSDDKGKIWINDELIWVSRDELKEWRPNEALRRVHLREGRNKILYRIENGHHGIAFSLWVHLEK